MGEVRREYFDVQPERFPPQFPSVRQQSRKCKYTHHLDAASQLRDTKDGSLHRALHLELVSIQNQGRDVVILRQRRIPIQKKAAQVGSP